MDGLFLVLLVTLADIENILQTYTLEEIFELNDTTEEEILLFLVEQEIIVLPNPEPL